MSRDRDDDALVRYIEQALGIKVTKLETLTIPQAPMRYLAIEDFPVHNEVRTLPYCCGERLRISEICEQGCHLLGACGHCGQQYVIGLSERATHERVDGPAWADPKTKSN